MADTEVLAKHLFNGDTKRLRRTLIKLTKQNGWSHTNENFQQALSQVIGTRWVSGHRLVLSLFESEALFGYDGDILEILDSLPNSNDFHDAEADFRKEILNRVKVQLENNGFTLFFDSEKLLNSPFADLLESLSEARLNEFKRELPACFPEKSARSVNVSGLWRTKYGYDMLKALNRYGEELWLFGPKRHYKAVVDFSSNLGIDVKKLDEPSQGPVVSDRMSDLIDSLLYAFGHSREGNVSHLFDTGFFDPFELVETCIDNVTLGTRWADGRNLPVYKLAPYYVKGIGYFDWYYEDTFVEGVERIINLNKPEHHTLLCKVLKSMPHFENWDYDDRNKFHVKVYHAVAEIVSHESLGAISHFIERVPYIDWGGEFPYLTGTAEGLFESALNLIIKHKDKIRPQDLSLAVDKLKRLMDETSNVGGVYPRIKFSEYIHQLQGKHSISELIDHLSYFGGTGEKHVNEDVERILASYGEEAVPLLKKHLVRWDKYLDEAVANLLLKIGGSGLDAVAEGITEVGHDPTKDNHILKTLFAKKHSGAISALLAMIYEKSHVDYQQDIWDDDDVRNFFEQIPEEWPLVDATKYLSNKNEKLRNGAWVLLQYKKEDAAIESIESSIREMLRISFRTAIKTATLYDSEIILCEFINWLKDFSHFPDLGDGLSELISEYILSREKGVYWIQELAESSNAEERMLASFLYDNRNV